jgi:hypothetical protein
VCNKQRDIAAQSIEHKTGSMQAERIFVAYLNLLYNKQPTINFQISMFKFVCRVQENLSIEI